MYIQTINEVADKGWEGFVLSGGAYKQPLKAAKTQTISEPTKSAIEHVEDVRVSQISA